MEEKLAHKRILLIFQASIGHSPRIMREISILNSAGAAVDIVSTLPNDTHGLLGHAYRIDSFEPQDAVSAKILSSNHPLRALRIGSNFVRNTLRKFLSARALLRGKSDLTEFLIENKGRYDVWWVYDSYGLNSARQAKKLLGAHAPKIVYETQDLVPEYFFGKTMSQRRKKWERESIAVADRMITAGDLYCEYYKEQYPKASAAASIFVWPNYSETIVPPRMEHNKPRTFIFYGNIAHNRPILPLIEALSLVDGDYHFTFVGDNRIGKALTSAIAEHDLGSKVSYLGQVKPSEGLELVSDFDFGVVALSGSDENERRAPASKVGTYLAAGIGIIASDLPGIKNLLEDHSEAIFVEGVCPKKWAKAFEDAISMSEADLNNAKVKSHELAKDLRQSVNKDSYIDVFV